MPKTQHAQTRLIYTLLYCGCDRCSARLIDNGTHIEGVQVTTDDETGDAVRVLCRECASSEALASKLCKDSAALAARNNDGWQSNPWPVGSDLWVEWGEHYNRTLAVHAEEDSARQALAAGKLAECEEELDAKEPQPSIWQRITSFFRRSKQ